MSHRLEQVASIIRRIVAANAVEVPPNVAKVVNITRVDVSHDLQFADVYVMALEHAEAAVRFLSARKTVIRRGIQKELRALHTIPSLRFHLDEHGEKLNRLDELLNRL
jgi:ribosome-binding factor A